jgi:hypothetical protein
VGAEGTCEAAHPTPFGGHMLWTIVVIVVIVLVVLFVLGKVRGSR